MGSLVKVLISLDCALLLDSGRKLLWASGISLYLVTHLAQVKGVSLLPLCGSGHSVMPCPILVVLLKKDIHQLDHAQKKGDGKAKSLEKILSIRDV